MNDKFIVDLDNEIKEAEKRATYVISVNKAFVRVLVQGVKEEFINGKDYTARYFFGELKNTIDTYGILFFVEVNGNPYSVLVPIDESVVKNDKLRSNAIGYAFEIFKRSFLFQLKHINKLKE